MWGPLAEPVHDGAAGDGDLPWRENAYFSFWDAAARAAGIVHVSTSPNAEGRRARVSAALGGRSAELVEPLDPLVLSSRSITVDLDGGVRVDGPGVALELRYEPRFIPADYSLLDGLLAPLGDAPPVSHYQQGAEVTGWLEVDGERSPVRGRGLRDRTWGFRDDQRASSRSRDDASVTVEYLAGAACFDGCDVTLMKMLRADGNMLVGGFVLDASGTRRVTDASITRDPAGLLGGLDVDVSDGSALALRALDDKVGFWLPLGVVRKGPVLSAYDEFVSLDGGPSVGAGAGVMEHGTVRRLT